VTVSIAAAVRARGDLAAIQQQAHEAITGAAAIWRQRLGQYLSLSALSCAVRAIPGVIDVDLSIAGITERQLQPHQFAVLTGVTVTMEAG